MAPQPPKVFLSYSQDSPEHSARVRALADHLCGDGVDAMIDQYDPHPKEPWPRWMDRQIEDADFVLVVCTEAYLRRAQGHEKPGKGLGATFESVLIIQDLYDAGMWNEKFIPVLFEGAASRFIPKPLRGYTYYRVDTEPGYDSLLRHLRNEPAVRKPEVKPGRPLPPLTAPAPSPAPISRYRTMAQAPEGFIHRREYDVVLDALCPKGGLPAGGSVGITTALKGAGGFGKTSLAQAICQDPRIRETYPDGILWTTMGESVNEAGRLSRLRDLIRWWTRDEAPAFETLTAAGAAFREMLFESRALIVLDDIWNPADVYPFQGIGKGTALLITTRDSQTLPGNSKSVTVDAMASLEAISLLSSGLAGDPSHEFGNLASSLGEWPLLLTLVNRQIQERVNDGNTISESLQDIWNALRWEGFSAFDRDDPESRNSAASKTIMASLLRLSQQERDRFSELAIFPEDVQIPLRVLERLWGIEKMQVRKVCRRLQELSLLFAFNSEGDFVLVHDVIRKVLVEKMGESLAGVHDRFLDAVRPSTGSWSDIEVSESYFWKHLSVHFTGAKRDSELVDLLWSFPFIDRKLKATDLAALVAEYQPFLNADPDLQLLSEALSSAPMLARDRNQLAPQIIGRLLGCGGPKIHKLLGVADSSQKGSWFRPRKPSLISPGKSHEPTRHSSMVNALALIDDRWAISGTCDGNIGVWDCGTGQLTRILIGHRDKVNAIGVVDDDFVLSSSEDKTLRLWNLATGRTTKIIRENLGRIGALAIADKRWAVCGLSNGSFKVFDLRNGSFVRTVQGHSFGVSAVAMTPGYRMVFSSHDGTLRSIDFAEKTTTLINAHSGRINTMALMTGNRAVSASYDGTIKVWDLEGGRLLRTLQGYSGRVNSVAVVSRDRVVFGSTDGILRCWDTEGDEISSAISLDSPVSTVAATIEKSLVVAGDQLGRVHFFDLA